MKTSSLLPMILICLSASAVHADGTASAQSGTPAAATASGGAIDCSAAYSGQAASCEQVACGQIYGQFLGTWSGQFWSYERKKSTNDKSVYRPYRNTVAYTAGDCLRNTKTGDVFIVGHQTDDYPAFEDLPAKVSKGLLITGKKADGTRFLRTVGEEGAYDYALVYRNPAAKLAVWKLTIPASGNNPAMTFTTIDGSDLTVPAGETRAVTVTMTVGSEDAPLWQGVIAYGSHTRQ